MNQTTPTGTEAGFDLDKLEALARANQCETMSIDLTVAPDIILELIALARQAAPDTTAQPVQAGEAVDERIMGIAHRWAQAAYAKALNKPGEDIDSIKHELRASLAPASTQQSAAKLAKVETFTIPHVSSRGNVFVLLSDLADGPVSAEQGAAEGCGCQQGQCCPVCDPDVYQQSAAKAPAAQAAPAGFKLVPELPTFDMQLAAMNAARTCKLEVGQPRPLPGGYELWSSTFVYRAMIGAAPEAMTSEQQPATQQDEDAKDAARWRFSMQFQGDGSEKEQPQAIIDLWRKVYSEDRLRPTREEYEAAIDSAMSAHQAKKGQDHA